MFAVIVDVSLLRMPMIQVERYPDDKLPMLGTWEEWVCVESEGSG